MDSSMLVFSLRIQETEALLIKRRAELHDKEQKRNELEQQLVAEENKQGNVLQGLAAIQQASQGCTHDRLQLQKDINSARERLAQEQVITELATEERVLEQQFKRLKAVTGNEQQLQQQYEDSINNHMEDKASKTRGLQAKATKIAVRFEQLLQQEQKLRLDQQLERLTQQQHVLQTELTQLTATLTSSKQANVVARAKVAAATSEVTSDLQAAQERCVAIKGDAFEMGRQHSVNSTRLKQLQQEEKRLRQQCCELDLLIARAVATIDQLTSSVDL